MPASGDTGSQRPLLLLIDDDAVSREVGSTLLRFSGFAVEVASSGAEALARLPDLPVEPALILTDAQMPGLHGQELIGRLRGVSRAQIVLVSGSQPEAGLVERADALLLKPYSPEAVWQLLEELPACPTSKASTEAPERPLVRPEILAQLRAMMPEKGVLQIYQAVIADLERRAELLEAALVSGNVTEIRRIGHAVKGGCQLAGAAQAARLGELLEELPDGEPGDQLDNIPAQPNDLRAAAEALRRMLGKEFPATGRG